MNAQIDFGEMYIAVSPYKGKNPALLVNFKGETEIYKVATFKDKATADWFVECCQEAFQKWRKVHDRMYDRNESSEGHCPLIEIKPHGRLIDAEEEIKVWDACGIPGVFPHSRTTVSKFLLGHCIGKIPPTIIPSDKEEES